MKRSRASPQHRAESAVQSGMSRQTQHEAQTSFWRDRSASDIARQQSGAIPRSHAFSSLAPLSNAHDTFDTTDVDTQQQQDGGPGLLKRTIPLHQSSEIDPNSQWRQRERSDESATGSAYGIEHQAQPGPSSQPMFRTGSNESQQSQFTLPTFLPPAEFGGDSDVDMDFDDDDDSNMRPPLSPTPFGDHTHQLPTSGLDPMDLSEVVLQPGIRHVNKSHRRTCSSVTSNSSSYAPSMSSTRRSHAAHSSMSSVSGASFLFQDTARRRSSTSVTADSLDVDASEHGSKPQSAAQRARASSSAALHRPLTEFLTPRSTSTSALLGEKLPSVANLFEFATQPRPVVRSTSHESQITPLRDPKRRSAGTPGGNFATGKLFENEIQAVKSAQQDAATATHRNILDASTPVRRGPKSRLDFVQEDRSETSQIGFKTPSHLGSGSLLSQTADDSGVAFADESVKSQDKFSSFAVTQVDKDSPLLGPARRFRSHITSDSPARVTSSGATPLRQQRDFQADSPARTRLAAFTMANPFGTREKSSLARETSFGGSSENGSGPPSPEHVPRERSRTTTASPGRRMRDRRPTFEADEGHHYMTPQNFKSVKPLQAAFMSTGLVSKRNRTRESSEGASGAEPFVMPSKPNFGHALGLREVVAAASAHAAAAGDRSISSMPDTPVKKSTSTTMIPFAKGGPVLRPSVNVSAATDSSSLTAPIASQASPISPLLQDSFASPTLRLASLHPPNASTPVVANQESSLSFARGRRSTLADPANVPSIEFGEHMEDDGMYSDIARSPSLQSGRTRDTLRLQKGKKAGLKPLAAHEAAPLRKKLSVNTLKASSAPRTLQVRSAGLMRKKLNIAVSEADSQSKEDDSFAPSTPITAVPMHFGSRQEAVPMTPTRGGAHIKWFEAAQVVTTPSPSSRRHAVQKLRAHHLELSQTRSKSRLSESSGSQETPMKAGHSNDVPVWTTGETSRLETAFIVEEVIGSGEFSEVVKAVSRSGGNAYAVKRMKKAYSGPKDRLRRLEEVDVLRQLSTSGNPHANIVSLFDAWEEEGHLFLQLELCPLGTLAFFLEEYGQQVGALDEPRLWKVAAELSSGLAHIHNHDILHLDLKPANILITEHGSLKISDFGMATRWPPADAETILKGAKVGGSFEPTGILGDVRIPRRGLEREGDREYLAPEVIFQGQYGKAADIFSLGLIILEAAGNVELPDNGEPWQKLRRDDFSDVDLSALSGSLLRLLESLLSSEPERRPTVDEIMAMPTMETVRNIMSRGLAASEMDQLPEFSESSTSGSLAVLAESGSTQSMQSDSSYHDTSFSSTETDSSMLDLSESGSTFALPQSGSAQTSISTSASLHSVALLKVRGALIQEPEDDFIHEVTSTDPFEQKLRAHHFRRRTQQSSSISSIGSSVGSPTTQPQRARRPLAIVQAFDLGHTNPSRSKHTQETDYMDLDA